MVWFRLSAFSVSPISAFSWEVFSDGLAWGIGCKRIVWLRHAQMLVCGGVFRGFSDGLSPRGGVGRPFSRVFDTPVDALFSNGSRGVHDGPGCVGGRFRVD